MNIMIKLKDKAISMIEKKKTGRPKLISSDKLAEALFQVFAQKGYASTSIADPDPCNRNETSIAVSASVTKRGCMRRRLCITASTGWGGWNSVCRIKHNFEQRMRHFLHDAFTLFSCDGKPLGAP